MLLKKSELARNTVQISLLLAELAIKIGFVSSHYPGYSWLGVCFVFLAPCVKWYDLINVILHNIIY